MNDIDLGCLALRASEASHHGRPLTVTPEEYRAIQQMIVHWDSPEDAAAKGMWKALLVNRHPAIKGIEPSFMGLPVVIGQRK